MIEPVEIQAMEKYRVWLRYSDGASGEVDLGHWAGQGVFQAWEEPGLFETVRITDYGSIAWGEDDAIEVCPDDLYVKLTGVSLEKLWPGLAKAAVIA